MSRGEVAGGGAHGHDDLRGVLPTGPRAGPARRRRCGTGVVRVDVAEAGEDVDVAGVGGDPQPRGDRAEGFDGFGQRRGGERQDVLPCLQCAVVPGAGAPGERARLRKVWVVRLSERTPALWTRGDLPVSVPCAPGNEAAVSGACGQSLRSARPLRRRRARAPWWAGRRTGRRTDAHAARRGSRRTPRATPAGGRRCVSRGRRARRLRIGPDAAGRTVRRSGRQPVVPPRDQPGRHAQPLRRLTEDGPSQYGSSASGWVITSSSQGTSPRARRMRPQGPRGADLAQAALKAQCRLQQGRGSLVLVRSRRPPGRLQAECPARVEEGMRIVQAGLNHHRLSSGGGSRASAHCT